MQNLETGECDTDWKSHLVKTSVKECEVKSPQSASGPQAPQTSKTTSKKLKRLPGSIPVPCRNKKDSHGRCRMRGKCWFQHPNVSPEPVGARPNCRNPVGECPFKDRCRYRHRNPNTVKRKERRKRAEMAKKATAEKRDSPMPTAPAGHAAAPAGPAAVQPTPATPRVIPITGLVPGVGVPVVEPASSSLPVDAASPPSGPPNIKVAQTSSPLEASGLLWTSEVISLPISEGR